VYRLSLSRIDVKRDWAELRRHYKALRVAVEQQDAIAAELAIENVFQLDQPLP
jgi:hypothetical protein